MDNTKQLYIPPITIDIELLSTLAQMQIRQKRILEETLQSLSPLIVEAVQDLQKTLQSPLFQGILKDMNKNLERLVDSTKILAQTYASFNTPILYSQITALHTSMVANLKPIGVVVNPSKSYKNQILEEKKDFDKELAHLKKIEPEIVENPFFYYPKTKTFIVYITEVFAVNFYSKRGADGVSNLFEVFYEALKEKGVLQNGYMEVSLTVTELLERLASKIRRQVNMNWIKNTRSNLVNHKLPSQWSDLIQISEFDRSFNGYTFRIKVATFVPKLI